MIKLKVGNIIRFKVGNLFVGFSGVDTYLAKVLRLYSTKDLLDMVELMIINSTFRGFNEEYNTNLSLNDLTRWEAKVIK